MDFLTMLRTFKEKVTETVNQIQANMNSPLQSEKLSINDLAAFIMKHSNTIKTSQQLLGIDLHEYNLKIDHIHFILETKGKSSEKIIALTLLNQGKAIIKYRSYDPNAALDNTFALPSIISQ